MREIYDYDVEIKDGAIVLDEDLMREIEAENFEFVAHIVTVALAREYTD